MSKNYPNEHVFLLNCAEASDFNNQIKAVFEKESDKLAEEIMEELDILADNLSEVFNMAKFIVIDEYKNYKMDGGFLARYRAIDSFIETIRPTQFECLCAYYLQWLGCDHQRVTRVSSDQGLDFYGSQPFRKHSFFNSVSEKVFLIGQAKLYTEQVGTGEIREFIGSIELIRRKIYSREVYSYSFASELKPYTLINPIFITSSRFSSDAISLCQQIGIRMIDRIKLISLLSSIDELFDGNNNFLELVLSQEIKNIPLAQNNFS